MFRSGLSPAKAVGFYRHLPRDFLLGGWLCGLPRAILSLQTEALRLDEEEALDFHRR